MTYSAHQVFVQTKLSALNNDIKQCLHGMDQKCGSVTVHSHWQYDLLCISNSWYLQCSKEIKTIEKSTYFMSLSLCQACDLRLLQINFYSENDMAIILGIVRTSNFTPSFLCFHLNCLLISWVEHQTQIHLVAGGIWTWELWIRSPTTGPYHMLRAIRFHGIRPCHDLLSVHLSGVGCRVTESQTNYESQTQYLQVSSQIWSTALITNADQ